jgi:N-sulfoglucosamine sulfohydrolase
MNILYIHTHDSGRFLKPYGYNVPTDYLMKFAKDAVVFRKAFCGAPTCSPSRSVLLTGMYAHNNGMLGLAHRGFKINDYSKHLASYLKKYDYETVLSGVQHEADSWLNYDKAAKTIGYSCDITTVPEKNNEEELVYWDRNNAGAAAEYIKRAAEDNKKFFMSFGMFSTHRKYPVISENKTDPNYVELPPRTYDNKNNREDTAKYMDSARMADDCIETVIEALKEAGLYEKTIIIFTTDHGVANPFDKCYLNDSGIGVALIIRDPKQKIQGQVIDTMVSHIDIFPTLCDLTGIEKPDWLQGKSLVPALSENEKVRDEIYAEINYHTSYEPARCIRNERYKYIKYFDETYNKYNYSNMDDSEVKKFLTDNGLLNMDKDMEILYDLYFDPGEADNVAGKPEYREILAEMREKLKNWQIETKDPVLNGKIEAPRGAKVNKKNSMSAGSKDKNDYEKFPE